MKMVRRTVNNMPIAATTGAWYREVFKCISKRDECYWQRFNILQFSALSSASTCRRDLGVKPANHMPFVLTCCDREVMIQTTESKGLGSAVRGFSCFFFFCWGCGMQNMLMLSRVISRLSSWQSCCRPYSTISWRIIGGMSGSKSQFLWTWKH